MIESDDIRALTWFAWRSGVLDAASESYAREAGRSFEHFVRVNKMIRNKRLPQFLEENPPRVGEFLIEFVTAENTDVVKVVLTSQRMWIFDSSLKRLTEIELSLVSSFEWQIRYFLLGYIKAIVKFVDGTVKSIKSGGVPTDDDALDLAIERCRHEPWAVSFDEKAWASFAAEQIEPEPDYQPIGIGVSPSIDSLVRGMADNEDWLYAGLATWTTIGTEAATIFQRWVNRAFLGVLGDVITPELHGKFGIVAFARSGKLYIATLGDYLDNRELEARISNATIDQGSVQSQHISAIPISRDEDRLVLEIDNTKLALSFPECFIRDNAQLGLEIERSKASAWQFN